jgi:hypothetical protein
MIEAAHKAEKFEGTEWWMFLGYPVCMDGNYPYNNVE